jgi:hypothetical protein
MRQRRKLTRTDRDSNRQSVEAKFLLGQKLQLSTIESGFAGFSPFPVEAGDSTVAQPVLNVVPGAQGTWYFYGPPGAKVTISLNRLQNSGGHNHPGGPAGSIAPQAFVLGPHYPQNQPAVFTAPLAAGSVQMVAAFSVGNPSTVTGLNRVAVPGLVILTGGVGISLTGASPTHPVNHSGLPTLVTKIQQLATSFHGKFGKNLFVNDMSLPEGGVYDFKNTWAPPHVTHREGRTVDINSTSMSPGERDFFKSTALALGFSVTLETNPEHWHLSI